MRKLAEGAAASKAGARPRRPRRLQEAAASLRSKPAEAQSPSKARVSRPSAADAQAEEERKLAETRRAEASKREAEAKKTEER